jgi:hypothetical protein
MSTGEGWPDVMLNSIDAVGVDVAPQRSFRDENALFYFAYIPLCVWFVLGLVIGAIIDEFTDLRRQRDVNKNLELLMTAEQRKALCSYLLFNNRCYVLAIIDCFCRA